MNQPSIHPAASSSEQLLAQCEVERLRRSGPGGQHRNKVETAIRLFHRPSGITSMASERRCQSANLKQALRRLKVNLALNVRTERDEIPSSLWNERCLGGRILVNPLHDAFPELLAEVLDLLASSGWDVRPTAEMLGCTMSQLIKFLRLDPRALELVNEKRAGQNLRRLQ